ncbi:MAG: carbamoyl phosphate synthase large subunit, partial [bacterium]|nr:carbamoyl phosphate synthase large subunit [bacterium]
RIFQVGEALRRGAGVMELAAATGIDAWFLDQIEQLVEMRRELEVSPLTEPLLRRAKRFGYSDRQVAYLHQSTEVEVRATRWAAGVTAAYKTVDTCAAEFEAEAPCLYSS